MDSADAVTYFELKYCERCGGLWLRPCHATAIYCSSCARQMAEVARHSLRRSTAAGRIVAGATAAVLPVLQSWLEWAWECAA